MINYIYFYKNNSKYGFLSQFYKCKFIENDIIFNSAEQYMMYNKAKLFNNIILANKILKETNPSIVKKYGRQVINFNEEIWVKHREEIVYNGNILKFTQLKMVTTKMSYHVYRTLINIQLYKKV